MVAAMKTLALLSIMLALPLAAQSVDAKPEVPKGFACSEPSGKITTDCPELKLTMLTPEEQVNFALAIMKAQGARINMLEKLIESKAGADDAVQIDKANQEQESMRQSLIKRHGACEGGQWNFTTKAWVCPPSEPAKPK